jgi:hypothetical protein
MPAAGLFVRCRLRYRPYCDTWKRRYICKWKLDAAEERGVDNPSLPATDSICTAVMPNMRYYL